jgi:LmbE family N-acetylglucosaminyl deacetylase
VKKVLLICAHPDDDILGCGGLMAKYAEKGTDFRVVFIAEGSSCRYPKGEIQTDEVQAVIQQRNEAGRTALNVLGVDDVVFHNLPCGRLDQVPIIEINKIIESEIRSFKPDTLFTHSENDANNDHGIVHKSTIMATRPNAINFVEKVYSYEILSSSEWKFTNNFKPNYFEELTEEQVELKWQALKQYETEIKEFPFPRSSEGIYTLAKFRGMQAGIAYAEAFSLIRHLNKNS